MWQNIPHPAILGKFSELHPRFGSFVTQVVCIEVAVKVKLGLAARADLCNGAEHLGSAHSAVRAVFLDAVLSPTSHPDHVSLHTTLEYGAFLVRFATGHLWPPFGEARHADTPTF